jgi:hypothetical protein
MHRASNPAYSRENSLNCRSTEQRTNKPAVDKKIPLSAGIQSIRPYETAKVTLTVTDTDPNVQQKTCEEITNPAAVGRKNAGVKPLLRMPRFRSVEQRGQTSQKTQQPRIQSRQRAMSPAASTSKRNQEASGRFVPSVRALVRCLAFGAVCNETRSTQCLSISTTQCTGVSLGRNVSRLASSRNGPASRSPNARST